MHNAFFLKKIWMHRSFSNRKQEFNFDPQSMPKLELIQNKNKFKIFTIISLAGFKYTEHLLIYVGYPTMSASL